MTLFGLRGRSNNNNLLLQELQVHRSHLLIYLPLMEFSFRNVSTHWTTVFIFSRTLKILETWTVPCSHRQKSPLSMGLTEVFTQTMLHILGYCRWFCDEGIGSNTEYYTILKIRLTATMALCFVLHSIASKFCDSLCFLAIACIELALSQNLIINATIVFLNNNKLV